MNNGQKYLRTEVIVCEWEREKDQDLVVNSRDEESERSNEWWEGVVWEKECFRWEWDEQVHEDELKEMYLRTLKASEGEGDLRKKIYLYSHL